MSVHFSTLALLSITRTSTILSGPASCNLCKALFYPFKTSTKQISDFLEEFRYEGVGKHPSTQSAPKMARLGRVLCTLLLI
ncbi:hypothetical protein C2G38_2171253 [Gigaspora rosea]|uniref:Secreted protein n=1 Tax=Gigaspora rosea TaxID=44941 RepID=A0A397VTZ0_9GLOM|nr:hypothetical protein C2G38_2171253 [Gigaspora rosea]